MKHLLLSKKQIIVFSLICLAVMCHFAIAQNRDPVHVEYVYENYVQAYQVYQNNILEQSDEQSQISIFNDDNSYAVKNNVKTYNDYSEINGVVISELTGSQNALECFCSYKWLVPIIVVASIAFLLFEYREKENPYRILEFSQMNGREILSVYRMSIIAGAIFFFVLLIQVELLLVSFGIYGGLADLGNSIQSIPSCIQVWNGMTVGQFLLLYIVIRALAITAFSLLFWGVLHLLDHKMLAVFFFAVLVIGEVLLNILISIQSRWNFLKIFNLSVVFNLNQVVMNYRNLGTPLGLVQMRTVFLLGICTMLGIGVALVFSNVSVKKISKGVFFRNLIEKNIRRFKQIKSCFESKLSWFLLELYHYLILQKGAIVCIFVFCVIVSQYQKDDIVFDRETRYLQLFYEEWEGQLSKELYAYMDHWKLDVETYEYEWSQAQEAYSKKEITFEEYDNFRYGYSSTEVERNAYYVVEEQIKRIEQNSSEKERMLWLVNEVGYKHLLGTQAQDEQKMSKIFILVLSVFVCFTIGNKRITGSHALECSCAKGRNKSFEKKVKVALSVIFVFSVSCYFFHFIYVLRSYGLSSYFAPLRSLSEYSEAIFGGSILCYYILQVLLHTAIYMLIGVALMWFIYLIRSVKK